MRLRKIALAVWVLILILSGFQTVVSSISALESGTVMSIFGLLFGVFILSMAGGLIVRWKEVTEHRKVGTGTEESSLRGSQDP